MATKAIKVKAHKRLSGTGKIEDVNAHIRKIEAAKKLMAADESVRSQIHARYPGINKAVINKFIDENGLNPHKMLKSIKSKKIITGDVSTAIVGTPNNPYFKKVIDLSK